MGAVYTIDARTGEVMIPAAYARNMLLAHRRSGALPLTAPASASASAKRRKRDGAGRPRGRPVGSGNGVRGGRGGGGGGGGGGAASTVGSSADRPLEIVDEGADDGV